MAQPCLVRFVVIYWVKTYQPLLCFTPILIPSLISYLLMLGLLHILYHTPPPAAKAPLLANSAGRSFQFLLPAGVQGGALRELQELRAALGGFV